MDKQDDDQTFNPGEDIQAFHSGEDIEAFNPGDDDQPFNPEEETQALNLGGDIQPYFPVEDIQPFKTREDFQPFFPGEDIQAFNPGDVNEAFHPGENIQPVFPVEDIQPFYSVDDIQAFTPVVPHVVVVDCGSSEYSDSLSRSESSSSSNTSKKRKCSPCCTAILEKLKIWYQKLQIFCEPVTKPCKRIIAKLVKYASLIMTFIALSLLSFDQYTDVKTGKTICNVGCSCVWNKYSSNNDTHCEAVDDSYLGGSCFGEFGNDILMLKQCNYHQNPTDCKNNEWQPTHIRHPYFCYTSVASIVGSSIITSTFLLYRLRKLHRSLFTYLGLNETKHSCLFRILYFALHILWILQILPYAWIVMTFFICVKELRNERKNCLGRKKHGEIEERKVWENRNIWDETNRRAKMFFSIFEDTPQITLHSMFIVNSAIKEERVEDFYGLDFLHWEYYLGAVTSIASMAVAVTLFKELPNKKNKCIQFTSSLLAVGSRALINASYASAIRENYKFQTWTLSLPPITAFCLLIIDKLVTSLYNGDIKFKQWDIVKHVHLFCEWVKHPNYTDLKYLMNNIFKKLTPSMVSLIFEGNTVMSLIPSYTYLAFAVVLNTVWASEVGNDPAKDTLLCLQYIALTSVLCNLVIVQYEGKNKVRCLLYSVLFLLFLGLIYFWIERDYRSLKKLYFTDEDVDKKADDIITEMANSSSSSLTIVLYISGLSTALNLIIKMCSLIIDAFINALIPYDNVRKV